MTERHIEAAQEGGAALITRNITCEVVMLNPVRFREIADNTENPDLTPAEPISGREAYQKYISCPAFSQ